MKTDRLLAKSWNEKAGGPPPPHIFLPQHLHDVYSAADRVLAATAEEQLAALGLEPRLHLERFRRIVLLAAAVHDLGKANDHFQGMICGRRDVRAQPQGLRHEWVTVLMLRRLWEWILPAASSSEIDLAIAEWAVAGHHPAVNHASPPRAIPSNGAPGPQIRLLMGHPDFQEALLWLHERFALGTPPQLSDQTCELVGSQSLFDVELARWSRSSQLLWERLKRSTDRFLVAAVKNCLIAADVAGSALARSDFDSSERWHWISASMADKPAPGDLQAIVDFRLKDAQPRNFQHEVATSKARLTLVKAGCGSGKTLAAYMWAARNHATRRLYFCYPTTGTATEGFKDYLFAPELESGADDPSAERIRQLGADLFHGRAEIDFEIVLETGRDSDEPRDEIIRIDSLRAWNTPVVACTIDTVLGIVQNNRRGIFAWPALAQSAFIFDEIHAYDDRLFGALLRFLQDLPALPVLLMTASLPKSHEDAVRNVAACRGAELHSIAGPAELEERPRYHRVQAIDNDPRALVEETINCGGKVLWVCNTVDRVRKAASATELYRPLLYHSRFKYEDRVARHKALIDAFNRRLNPGAALGICSQVAEMSLDLSADLLVTDLAPVPALIQRLGRLNRWAIEGDPTKPVLVIEPDTHLPYGKDELSAARAWLAALPKRDVSQRMLAELWEQKGDEPIEPIQSAWLDGGPFTKVSELREASPGITVLMREDVPKVQKSVKNIGRYALPMRPPRRLQWQTWSHVYGLPVAESGSILYDRLRGAEWQND